MACNIGSKLPLVALCFFVLLIQLTSAARSVLSDTKYAEVQEHLKLLNKPPVKSIQSPDGDIIDCVLAAHQPAFDEPLLKNQVFQVRPSTEPEGYESNEETITQIWHDAKEECPDGTVAIRRVKEEDLLRASSIREYGREKYRGAPNLNTTDDLDLPALVSAVHEYAIVGVTGKVYHGTQTSINLWNPDVNTRAEEFSLSQLWLSSGSGINLNTIEVGWQIYQRLYGDNKTRLFVFWTRDNYMKTRCYNLMCPKSGFVQTSKTLVVGGALSPVSVYGGTQHSITILVWKEKSSGKWWLKVGSEWIGYWPPSLFTKMGNGATEVQWGGEITNRKTGGLHTTTDMGSGHFSKEGDGKASFFKNVQIIDKTDKLTNVSAFSYDYTTNPKCYDIKSGKNDVDGAHFHYGGPGRNPSCP